MEYTATFRIKPFSVPLDRPIDQIEDVTEWANALVRHENAHPPTRTIDVVAAAHAIHLMHTLPQPQDFSSEINIEEFHTQLEGEIQWSTFRKEHVCQFLYTIRSRTDQRAELMRQRIEELLKSVGKMYNVEIATSGPTVRNYPALEQNHKTFQKFYMEAWTELGHENHWIYEPILDVGTDDVIYILNKVDKKGGCAAYVGLVCDDQDGKITTLHTPTFDFPDQNLVDGVKATILVLHKILAHHVEKY